MEIKICAPHPAALFSRDTAELLTSIAGAPVIPVGPPDNAITAGSILTISGSGSFHYDEALNGSNPAIGNYAFASWFEDNSDPTHKDVNGNYVVY